MDNDRHVCNHPRQIVVRFQEYHPETMRYLYSPFEKESRQALPPTWQRSEEVIIEEYDFIEEHRSWYDARKKYDEWCEYIEIKSCATRYQNGQVGEFQIWDRQYRKLSGQGKFGLLVYRPGTHRIIATCIIRPFLIGENGESRFRDHPTMGYGRLWHVPWPKVVPLETMDVDVRDYWTDRYYDEKVDETFTPERR